MSKQPENHYSTKIQIKVKQLNDLVNKKQPNVLPNIYAKARDLNRRFSLSTNSVINHESDFGSSSCMTLENMSEKERKDFLKEYRTRKRSIIVSKYVDEDLQQKFEQVKYSLNPSRRQSIFDSSQSEHNDLDNLSVMLKKRTSLDETSSFNIQKNKSPRFGSTLSKDGQYALMKSLEDTIINEIESTYPEFKGKVPRTSTAQYRKSLNDLNSNSSMVKLSQISHDTSDDVYYSKSELFVESDTKDTIQDNELHKQLIVTHHIDSAMDILDKIRMNSQKIQAQKKQGKRVNYLEPVIRVTPKKVLGPIKPKSTGSTPSLDSDDDNDKFEPLVEMKNTIQNGKTHGYENWKIYDLNEYFFDFLKNKKN